MQDTQDDAIEFRGGRLVDGRKGFAVTRSDAREMFRQIGGRALYSYQVRQARPRCVSKATVAVLYADGGRVVQ